MKNQKDQILYLRSQNTDLLNRIQADDFKTYTALSTPAPDTPYVSRSDAHDLQILAQAQGIGSVIYDDGTDDSELRDALAELGIRAED